MFDFLKKDEKTSKDVEEVQETVNDSSIPPITDEEKREINALLTELYNSKVNDAMSQEFEYVNTYLAQLVMTQRELLKQQTVANALTLLQHQYEHADSFMTVDEIQKKYLGLAGEIFVDYAMEDENLNNLEEKD